jgi:hypothetical protein
MAKRERAQRNSVTSQIEQFREAGKPIEPSMSLLPAELTYFNQITSDREAASWSSNHLTIATNLAKTYAAIDRLWDEISDEGFTTVNDRGTTVANAKVTVLNQMTQAMQSLNRTLGLSASQRGLAGAKQGDRNKNDRKVREINAKHSDDDDDSLV